MKISRRTLYILLPVIVLVVLGAVLAGFACTPPGTMPRPASNGTIRAN